MEIIVGQEELGVGDNVHDVGLHGGVLPGHEDAEGDAEQAKGGRRDRPEQEVEASRRKGLRWHGVKIRVGRQ